MNTLSSMRPLRPPAHTARPAQSGIVLVMTLICLVLLLVASVALTRSSTNALLLAGNFAFQRDLLGQAERGMAAAVKEFASGTLATESARMANQPNVAASKVHYSAAMLDSNAQGIPTVLVSETSFQSAGMSASADYTDTVAGVTIRTVIDRQCSAAGVAFDAATCVSNTAAVAAAQTGSMSIKRAKGESRPTYRISVRVTGPRNTQAFQQMVVAY